MLEVSERDGIAVLTLNRPPVNALDLPMIEALTEAARASVDARAVLLTGTGKAFSAGVDTRAFENYDAATRGEMIEAITAMGAALLAIPVPVLAAINGHALGGGLVLPLCADYRLACEDDGIRFGLTEARAGIPFPAGPLEIMARELPPALCRHLTLSSAIITPAEAAAHNVIDELCAGDELVERALARAAEIAAQPAFAIVKQQIRGPLIAAVRALAERRDDPLAAMMRNSA